MFKSSVELSKSGQGFAQGQQWSLGVGHIPGVGSGHARTNPHNFDGYSQTLHYKGIYRLSELLD